MISPPLHHLKLLSSLVVESDTFNLIMAGSSYGLNAKAMGVAILAEHFKSAYFGLVNTTTARWQAKRIHESIVFISGTDMNAIIQVCRLDLDPETLRQKFFHYCHDARAWKHVRKDY